MDGVDKTSAPLGEDEFGQTIAERVKRAGEPGEVVYDSHEFCILVKDKDGDLIGQFNLDNVYKEYSVQPAAPGGLQSWRTSFKILSARQ